MQEFGKGARLSSMTPSDLQMRVENDPHAVVMEYVHDNVFKPWEPSRVRSCVRRIAQAAHQGKGVVDALLEQDAELREFSQKHPVIFAKVSTPEVAGSETLMGVIEHMLKVRGQVAKGNITESEARADVSDVALLAVAGMGGTTPTPDATPVDHPEKVDEGPRIVELD